MKMTTFCIIQGFPNYGINENGFIKNFKTDKILKPMNHSAGYLAICLYENKKPKRFLIHRLVANAFLPNPENKKEVNHINGNKKDNRLENLEWCTSSENRLHSYKHGLQPINKGMLGRKLSEETILKMKSVKRVVKDYAREAAYNVTRKKVKNKLTGEIFKSMKDAAKNSGLSYSAFQKAIICPTHRISSIYQIIEIA